MESTPLVPQSSFKLPIANLRSVYRTHDVERKLAKLPERDYENLRTTYERMLERGPERFQVKPAGVPDMASLYEYVTASLGRIDGLRTVDVRPILRRFKYAGTRIDGVRLPAPV